MLQTEGTLFYDTEASCVDGKRMACLRFAKQFRHVAFHGKKPA